MPEGAFDVLPAGKEYAPYIAADTVIPEVTVPFDHPGPDHGRGFFGGSGLPGLENRPGFRSGHPHRHHRRRRVAACSRGKTPSWRTSSSSRSAPLPGLIVAGAIFTLPALFILGLDKTIGFDLFKIFMVSFLGGTLGVLFLIPFRKYFVKEMHGHFPFPEATATTQVLVAGEKGGAQAKILVKSMLIGGIFDFMVHSVGAFNEVFTTRIFGVGKALADKAKIVFKMDVLSAVLGLGYIIGLKYTSIIAAGSLLSWFLLVPVIYYFGQFIPAEIVGNAPKLISAMSAEEIFRNYVRFIGIGAIAMAGIIGILKSSKIIIQAFGMGFKQMFRKAAAGDEPGPQDPDRPEHEIRHPAAGADHPGHLGLLQLLGAEPGAAPPPARPDRHHHGLRDQLPVHVGGGARHRHRRHQPRLGHDHDDPDPEQPGAGGRRPDRPVRHVRRPAHRRRGLHGAVHVGRLHHRPEDRLLAGLDPGQAAEIQVPRHPALVADRGTGHLPAEPDLRLHQHVNALAAPQANAMAALIQPLMNPGAQVPWLLYGVGVLTALIMEFIGVPPLAFALGMYIPLELNTPLVIGGLIAHLISRSSKDKELATKRYDKGILIASGFIAGGAIIGVVSAILKYFDVEQFHPPGLGR